MSSEGFEQDLVKALSIVKSGGVILYPTDTIWGIGCDATDEKAVGRIFSIKNREDGKALISLVDSLDTLKKWIVNIPTQAIAEIEATNEPLTIIFDSPRGIASNLLAPDGSAAFRITSNPYAKELCRRLSKPLVSTSANISQTPAPADFKEISPDILDSVDYIVEFGREDRGGKPSKILKISDQGLIERIR